MILKFLSLLLIVHINAVPHRFVDTPGENVESFVRSSVEYIPDNEKAHSNLRVKGIYDTEDIIETKFSRSAVESIPRTVATQYLPLRSAVEYNPGVEQFSHLRTRREIFFDAVLPAHTRQSKAFDLEAYIVPSNPYDSDPYFYRVGSPYQQIIDAETYERLTQQQQQLQDPGMNTRMMPGLRKNDLKVVCHTTNWAFYRKGEGKFVPENLDYSLCTHIIYSYATLDPEQFIMLEFDPWADVENKLYARTVKLANGKPVLLAIGGWTDSTNDKYSRLVGNRKLRANFIDNVAPFLKRYGFAGLHFDWNYPTCPQSDCKIGNENDKANFAQFIKELKSSLKQSDLMLSIAVSGYKEIITQGYDFVSLSKSVDFMTVMTYDYHGAWETVTGHVSPLYGSQSDKYPQYNTDYTIKLLVELGADKEKLVMGVPFYGQSFTLRSTNSRGYNSQAHGPGAPGEFTSQPGMLAYYEICSLQKKSGYKKGFDQTGNSGPYVTNGKDWVGFDDPEMIRKKAKYVVDNGLGGISAWTVDLDDFDNKCCNEAFPLLKAINRGLGKLSTAVPSSSDCIKPAVVTPPPVVMQTTVDSGHAGIPNESSTRSTTTTSWWTESSTKATKKTTTRKPAVQSTTKRPYYASSAKPTTSIPGPVNVMPDVINNDETCIDGQYSAHPTDCSQYIICNLSKKESHPCPSGLHWNDNNKHCDWPENANCKSSQSPAQDEYEPEPSSSSTTSTTTSTVKPTRSRRTRTTRVTTAKRTRPTTTTTVPTTTEIPTTVTTTEPATTSRRTTKKKASRRPATTTRPTYYETTTTTYTTTIQQDVTSRKPIRKPTKCSNGEYLPHKDCGKYYICTNNKRVPMFCPEGLQFSHEDKICDYEEKVKCVSRKKYQKLLQRLYRKTGVYTAALLRAQAGDVCSNGQRYASYPGNCKYYLECVHEKMFQRDCPMGLIWNPGANNCDWPQNYKCPYQSEEEDEEDDYYDEEEEEDNDEKESINQNQGNDILNVFVQSSTSTKPPMKPAKPTTSTSSSSSSTGLVAIPVNDHIEPLTGNYKLICYFTNWAWYRPGDGKYLPNDIDSNLCTHIVYGFAVLHYDELTIKTHDSWADIDNRFYERVIEMKNKGVKVTLAIGGWNDSLGDKYSRLVRSASARAKFIKHVVEFLEKYGFEGLDLDWEYPVCWQVDCHKGHKDEKQYFATFVRELSDAFKPRGLLLSAAVSPSKTVIDAGYDVPELSKYFDWIAVMCYDYHGQWDKKTGHVSPLYYHPEDEVAYFNTNFTMHYWMKLGAPKEKLIMGMPLYGQSFTLADPKNNGLNAKAPGAGQAGEFTRAAGFLSYYEICDRIKNRGWEVVQDPEGRLGPYAYKGNQWVSFDDQTILMKKTQFIKQLGLGGGMIWALDLDDFKGSCGQGKHPLLKVIHAELQGTSTNDDTEDPDYYEEEEEEEVKPQQPVQPETSPAVIPVDKPVENEEEASGVSEEGSEEGDMETEEEELDYDDEINEIDDFEYKVVCYFTNWAWYRPGIGKFVPEDIDPELCTHIVYGFAVLDRDTLTIKPHDSWADIDNRFYERVTEFKKRGIKVTVAIGGWNDSAGDKYSRLVTSPEARKRFVRHVTDFITKHNFDGLDLDWEYPVCWQVECHKGKPEEKQAFSKLVKELSAAFKPKNLLLSSAVSPSKKVIDAGYEVKVLSDYFDWIAVMAYDYHGQWDKKTGHVAPMYVHPESSDKTFNTNFTINYWIEKGADPRKLVLGMPMYGQSFSLADRNNVGLNSPSYGGGEAGEETRARGFLSYYEICTRIKRKGWKVVKDSRGTIGPYAYSGDQWVSFDDIYMIRHKSEFVKAMSLGGAMIWALDLDDFKNTCDCEEYPLLRTINRVLRKYPAANKDCGLENRKVFIKPTAEATTKKPTTRPTTTTKKPSTQKPDEEEYEEYDEEEEEDKPVVNDEIPDDGSCVGKNFRPHETDCTKFYMCNNNASILSSCGHGLYWNQAVSACDWPSQVSCTSVQQEEQDLETNEVSSDGEPSHSSTTRRTTTTTMKTTRKPRPTKPPVVNDPFKPTGNNDYMVVCYFTNWAWYRPGIGKYKPDDIDTTLCTHIVYGFAVLNGETSTIRIHDSWADVDNKFFTRVTDLREKGVKVSIALGGWNDSLGNKYSKLVLNPENRKRFIKNVIEFMKKYNFEGLDLDWEYPVCWQVDCSKGDPKEKEGFTAWVRELREAFEPEGFLLSAAVSPSKKVIDAGYDIPELSEYFDWISVMTYDYHGQWDKKTGHVAPMFEHPDDWETNFNTNFTMNYWIDQGAPRSKLVMGMPMYGQAFSLEKEQENGLNAKAPGPGQAGEFTRSAGFLAFYEICYKVNNDGWNVVKDPQGRMGPYAYKGRQWVSYDDVEQIRLKTKYVKDMNLAGAMIWALDLDDFRNRCGCGTHPLLSTINAELNRINTPRLSDCT